LEGKNISNSNEENMSNTSDSSCTPHNNNKRNSENPLRRSKSETDNNL